MTRRKEEIILFWRICQFDRYRNISLSLKNVMFVIVQLVLGGVSVETNRTVEYAFWLENAGMGWIPWRYWRYWNIVEFEELPGKAGRS